MFAAEFCNPAAGWEKGQIEKNVRDSRDRLWHQVPALNRLDELNVWLEMRCKDLWQQIRHPNKKYRMLADVWQDKVVFLMPVPTPFEGFIEESTSVSLPRERFWDVQVSKIDSPTRQPLVPWPSCVRAASPHLRKLGAGYAALPQMTGRNFSDAYFVFPLRYRTPEIQCGLVATRD